MSADTVTFDFDIPGLARPVVITAEFEPPDHSVGISGGYFLTKADLWVTIDGSAPYQVHAVKVFSLDRELFEATFGRQMLQAAEEYASDVAQDRRYEDQDRREEVEA